MEVGIVENVGPARAIAPFALQKELSLEVGAWRDRQPLLIALRSKAELLLSLSRIKREKGVWWMPRR